VSGVGGKTNCNTTTGDDIIVQAYPNPANHFINLDFYLNNKTE
jgi:hypothetical protein